MIKRIPDELFGKIMNAAPMVCVDLLILHKGRVLMVYREREPVKHTWFYPGGRVLKNEHLEDAVHRKAMVELGIEVKIVRKVNFYETIFKTSPIDWIKTGTHTISCLYLVEPVGSPEIKLDKDHSKFKWIDRPEKDLHPYIRQSLKDVGAFS